VGERVGELRVRRGMARAVFLLLIAAGLGWGMPQAHAPVVLAAAEAAVPALPGVAAATAAVAASQPAVVMTESSGPTPEMTARVGPVEGPPVPPTPPPPGGFVPVLVYHHFLPEAVAKAYPTSELIVSTEDFTAQMRLLAEGGYHTITTADLAAWLLRGEPLPSKPVLITFDDGYESQYVYALPILKTFNLKATVFIITGDLHEQNPAYSPRVLSALDWHELKAMADSGLIDVEDHTHAMHNAVKGRGAGLSLSDQAVLDDLALSKRILSTRLDRSAPVAFAYPRGDYDARYIDLVKKSGFQLAFSVAGGPVREGANPFTLHRIGVFRHHWLGTFRKMVDGQYNL